MRLLRPTRRLASFVLAWLLLALASAVLSPAFGAGSLELVCSGGSVKLAPHGGEGADGVASAAAHCPACLPFAAPPPAVPVLALSATGGDARVARVAVPLLPPPPVAAWNARAPPRIS